MGAEQLMTAKITEFAAHLTAGDRSAAGGEYHSLAFVEPGHLNGFQDLLV